MSHGSGWHILERVGDAFVTSGIGAKSLFDDPYETRQRFNRGFGRMGSVFGVGNLDGTIHVDPLKRISSDFGTGPASFSWGVPEQIMGVFGSSPSSPPPNARGNNQQPAGVGRYDQPDLSAARASSASQSWGNVQGKFASVRYNELKKGLEALKAAQRQGGGGNSVINARIGRAKGELAEGNELFDDFFEDIAPGFEEALNSAKGIAEAEAAIEGHFTNTQEAIDERYADSEGAILAIADSFGNTNASLQEALSTSVYEFKEFIDEDLHLEKNQAQALNAAASSLAVAAAEAASTQARGAGARDQFSFQKRYEKIIQNLLDQRAAASAARGNALAGAAQQLLTNFKANQPYTRAQMGTFVMSDMINQVVPPAQQAVAYDAVEMMRTAGIDNWNTFRQALRTPPYDLDGNNIPTEWVDDTARQMWLALAPYSDVLESATNNATHNRIDELYNQAFTDPQTTFDLWNVGREEAFEAGYNFQDASNYANQQLVQPDTSDFSDLGALLDQLDLSEFEALFGVGLDG